MGIGQIFGRREASRDFLRDTGELTINLPALPRPTLDELQKQYSWITSIERDTSPESPVTLTLATVLKPGERYIDSTEYERRLAPKPDVLLGFQHQQWLLTRQDEFPALKPLLGKIYIDFSGIVVRSVDGDRYAPCCRQGCERWFGYWSWFDDEFYDDGRVAVACK